MTHCPSTNYAVPPIGTGCVKVGASFTGSTGSTKKNVTKNTRENEEEHSQSKGEEQSEAESNCDAFTVVNSRAQSVAHTVNENNRKLQEDSSAYVQEIDAATILGATFSSKRGESLSKGQKVSKTLRGFTSNFVASETAKDMVDFFKATSGSVKIEQTNLRMYGAIMEDNAIPAFSENFKKEIQNLHTVTMLVGKINFQHSFCL